MEKDYELNNLTLRALRKFHEFLANDPALATEDDLRRYLLHIVDTKPWRPSTVNVAQQALKQFFRLTIPRDWKTLQQHRSQVRTSLPQKVQRSHIGRSIEDALRLDELSIPTDLVAHVGDGDSQ